MGTVTFQLNPVLQDDAPQATQQPAATGQSVNANQAQVEPAPQDLVTLSAKLSDSPGARREPHWTQFDRAGLLEDGNSVRANGTLNSLEPGLLPAPGQVPEPQTANGADLQDGISETENSVSLSTPAQQLEQLDRTLQELGINPQSISLFHRMGMLLYANNPAALKDLVQQLPKAVEILTNEARNDPSASNSQSQAQDQTQTENVASGSIDLEIVSAQFSLSKTQVNSPDSQAQSSQAASQPTESNSNTGAPSQSATVAIQLEELQISLTQSGGQSGQPVTISVGSSNANGNSLDVTV